VNDPLVMQFQVAQLLKDGVGATREYLVDDEIFIFDDTEPNHIKGTVKLLRTSNGILVKADLATQVTLECARCLKPYSCELKYSFEEEYLPSYDIYCYDTGEEQEDKDTFYIDENNYLDITDAARQYAILTRPMKPLCRHNCPGIKI
jgi:uncharacterized metal-binding protein YceD (DUF177 family)